MTKKAVLALVILAVASAVVYYLYRSYGGTALQPIANRSQAVSGDPAEISLDNPSAPVAEPVQVVKPTIKVLGLPEKVKIGDSIKLRWQIEATEARPIFHTAVHYGPESPKGELTVKSYPAMSAVHQGTIPDTFEDSLVAVAPGKLYLRAHVIVDGVNYWSSESVIEVAKK